MIFRSRGTLRLPTSKEWYELLETLTRVKGSSQSVFKLVIIQTFMFEKVLCVEPIFQKSTHFGSVCKLAEASCL